MSDCSDKARAHADPRIENERLRDEVARLKGENMRMRELVSDLYDAWCFECDPWAEGFACAYFDGSECSVKMRMTEMVVER